MTPAVIGLIALGAITHATWNLTIKRSGAGGPVFIWLTAVIATAVVLPAALLWGSSSATLTTIVFAGAISAVLHIGYFLMLQQAYRMADASVVYPLARGTGPLLAVIGAIVLLGERPGPWVIVGAVVVTAGVMVIGFSGGRKLLRSAGPGMLLGLATGVAIAAYTLWDAHAVTVLAVAPLMVSAAGTTGQTLLLAPVALRDRHALREVVRRFWRPALVVGILSPVSYISILVAFQLAPVAVVAPGREVSVVLVALAGWLVLKEPHPVQRLVGAVVVLLGVGMLAVA